MLLCSSEQKIKADTVFLTPTFLSTVYVQTSTAVLVYLVPVCLAQAFYSFYYSSAKMMPQQLFKRSLSEKYVRVLQ